MTTVATAMETMPKAEARVAVLAARTAVKAAHKRGVEPDAQMLELAQLPLDTDQATATAEQ